MADAKLHVLSALILRTAFIRNILVGINLLIRTLEQRGFSFLASVSRPVVGLRARSPSTRIYGLFWHVGRFHSLLVEL
jgi:hypothetical protein